MKIITLLISIFLIFSISAYSNNSTKTNHLPVFAAGAAEFLLTEAIVLGFASLKTKIKLDSDEKRLYPFMAGILLPAFSGAMSICIPPPEAETMQTPWPAITQGFIGTIAVWFILGLVTIAHKLGSGPDAASKSLL